MSMQKRKYQIFNQSGRKIKTITIGSVYSYKTEQELEGLLQEKGWYAQPHDSFQGHTEEWHHLPFKTKLIDLGWSFDGQGDIQSARRLRDSVH